jgi:hypothetical protein
MNNIREKMQTWLELATRSVKKIPFEKEVQWTDIEDVYHTNCNKPMFIAHHEQLTFENVFCDAISIDHMCAEILEGDFTLALSIINRYSGITLSNGIAKEY